MKRVKANVSANAFRPQNKAFSSRVMRKRTKGVLAGLELAGAILLLGTVAHGQVFTTLHSFSGSDGAWPESTLVVASNVIYGITDSGGAYNNGVVFSMNTNGSDFRILHAFTGGADGAQDLWVPNASLLLVSNVLYGTVPGVDRGGIATGNGVVFSMMTNGSQFTVLHTFSPRLAGSLTNQDGISPSGPLLFVNNKLYGATAWGGSSGWGTIFSMDSNGSNFITLHVFGAGGTFIVPWGPLQFSQGRIYGGTAYGDFLGAIFSCKPDGSDFVVLRNFPRWSTTPGLLLTNNSLFGITYDTGQSGRICEVFKMDLTGNLTVLHTFDVPGPGSVTNQDGLDWTWGPFAFGTNILYRATPVYGPYACGTVYSLRSDGLNFKVLHAFSNAADGAFPGAGVTLSGNTLYGSTRRGGKITDGTNGTIFRIDLVPIPLPVIVSEPSSRTNLAGTTATFSVSAAGQPPLTYQWLRSTNLLANQLSTNLVLTNVTDTNADTYRVVVSNDGGSITSAPAWLIVLDPPSIVSQPASRTNIAGTTAVFGVGAIGTPPLKYQWFKGVNALRLETNQTLTLNRVSKTDEGTYHVVITNGVGKATSSTATLVVLPPPPIRLQVQVNKGSAVFLWPTGLTGFNLEWTTNLARPAWHTNFGPPVITNGLNSLIVPFSGQQGFFRLGE